MCGCLFEYIQSREPRLVSRSFGIYDRLEPLVQSKRFSQLVPVPVSDMSSELPDASRVFSSCATLDDGVAHVASQSATPVDDEELLVRQLEDQLSRVKLEPSQTFVLV